MTKRTTESASQGPAGSGVGLRQLRIRFQPETDHGSGLMASLMAKKKTEGLLFVEVPDLFAGLDLFEVGWQTAIIGAPEIAVAAATEELPGLSTATAEPV